MTSLLEAYTPRTSFWEAHPQFKKLGIFSTFYKADVTNKRWKSSNIMWGIAFLVDTSKFNKFKNFPEEERKELIKKEIINKEKFSWKPYEKYIKFFEEVELTPAKRSYRILRKKIDERMRFLEDTEYTVANAKELDSIIANTDKLFDLMTKLEKQIEKEDNESSGVTKGGRTESATELGLL